MLHHLLASPDASLLIAATVTMAFTLAGLVTGRAPARRFLLLIPLTLTLMLLGIPASAAVRATLDRFITHTSLADIAASLATFAFLGFAAGRAVAGRRPAFKHLRGAEICDAPAAGRAGSRKRQLSLAGIPIPHLDETKHFKLIGTTGTGKSTAIRELLGGALRRGDRAVIADPDAGYLNDFYNPARGDVLLNPFDPRSHRWDLFAEIETPYDVDQLARALIPETEGGGREWRAYARTFLTAVTRQLFELYKRDAKQHATVELFRLLTTAPTQELKTLLARTPAQPFLESGNERMFGSIRSVTAHAVASLEPISTQTGAPFSIRHWIRSGPGTAMDNATRGALFLPYDARQIAALAPMISAWLRLAIFETMDSTHATPARDQRLWFIVDELDALGPIDGLKDALARLRKFGGRCVLGFQSIAQVSGSYGDPEAQTIVENCGNTLILRCSASEQGGTAKFVSHLIGEREVEREQTSTGKTHTGFATPSRRTTSTTTRRDTEDAILASEIERLPDLTGYLKLASSPVWHRVTLRVHA